MYKKTNINENIYNGRRNVINYVDTMQMRYAGVGVATIMIHQDVTLYVEHQFTLQELDERGIEFNVDLECCRI